MSKQRASAGGRRPGRVRLTASLALIAAATLVAVPTAAFAQQIGPTNDQYDPSSTQIQGSVASGESSECGGSSSATDGSGASSGTATGGSGGSADSGCEGEDRVIAGLPFTGMDLGLLAVVAMLLGGSGIALRRMAGSSVKG